LGCKFEIKEINLAETCRAKGGREGTSIICGAVFNAVRHVSQARMRRI
jgi:hypothetical protein